MNKILILKNDRAGDLMTSLKLISSLNCNSKLKIYLSELNYGFSFFFKDINIEMINFNLNFKDKIKIFFDLYNNSYDKVYILTPKSFYFFLPLFFRKIKFYSIVYDNKRNRPTNWFRKFLFKYRVIYRNKINASSYRDIQLDLLDKDNSLDHNYSNLHIPQISTNLCNVIPKRFLYFQFRYHFFLKLGWGLDEFNLLMNKLLTKYENILFSSDSEKSDEIVEFNKYFEKNYSIIDTNKYFCKINKLNKKIFYLKDINAKNLFLICKESQMNLAKEGIISHISYFHNVKCHNIFNFQINSYDDYKFQKISYSEWCKGMNLSFSFLNSNINKSIKKILRNV